MSIISQVACLPCRAEDPPLSDGELAKLHPEVLTWRVIREDGVRKLRNQFTFDGAEAQKLFLERLAKQAERENHHPEVEEQEGKVTVSWWTHVLKDLHPNDFVMAAKTEGAYSMTVVGHQGDTLREEPLPTLLDLPLFEPVISILRGE